MSIRGDVDNPARSELGPCYGQARVEEVGQQEVAQIIHTEMKLEILRHN